MYPHPSNSFMKTSTCLLLIYIHCLLFVMHSKAESGFLPMLPGDTVFLLEVDDWKELGQSIESGPLGEFSGSKAWGIMTEWAEQKMKSELGDDSKKIELLLERMEEWEKSVSGGAVLAVGNLEKILSKQMPDFTMLMQTDATQSKLEDTLRWMKKEVTSSEGSFSWEKEKIAGEMVHWIGPDNAKEKEQRLAVLLVDQILGILVGGDDHVRETILRMEDESESMAGNDNYLDLFDEINRGAARMFINFEPLQALIKQAESASNMQIPENPFGVTTTSLISAMGLDSIECLGLQIDPSGQNLVFSSAVFLAKYEGLFSFLQNEGDDEAVQYGFIPTQAFTATSVRYDFAKIWPTMEKMITGLSPQLMLLVNSQIQAFEEKSGVAFRRDVMGTFGDEAFSFSLLPDRIQSIEDLENSSDFFGISLTDSKLFDRSLRTMIDSVAPGNDLFTERLHRGVTIRKLRGLEESGISLSYAVTDKWLLLAMGQDNQLNQIINRMNGKGRSLWKKKEIEKALADLPEDLNQLEFADFEKLVKSLTSLAVIALESEEEIEMKASYFPDFPYFLIGWSKNVRRGMIAEAKLYPKPN